MSKSFKVAHSNSLMFVIGGADVGGSELQILQHASEMKNAGYKVSLVFLTNSTGQLIPKLKNSSVDYFILSRFKRRFFFPIVFIRLFFLIILKKTQIVNAYLPEAQIAVYLTHLFIPLRFRPQLICSVRGQFDKKHPIITAILKRSMESSSLILVNSISLKDFVASQFSICEKKILTIANGLRLHQFPVANYSCNKAIYLANFLPYKGHAEFLNYLKNHEFQLDISFVGLGSLRGYIEDLIRIFGLNNQVEVVADTFNPISILSNYGYAIHPSQTEGLSNAILEEFAAGLPVIAFDVGGNHEIIDDGLNGFLAPNGDFESFFESINLLSKNLALRRELGLKAFEKSKQFGWETHSSKMSSIYSKLLSN